MESIKKQTLSGVKWTAMESFSTQAITFVIGIILARLLSPSDYGIIGVLSVFMAVSGAFIDSGFGQALIRKQNLRDIDYSTVFYFNIVISIICYLILFFCSSLIADFFKMPILTSVVKVYCLTLIIGAFEAVQISRLTSNLNFKALAKANVVSTIVSGITGLSLAYLGYGIWALVLQSVFSRVFHLCIIWIIAKWHPTFSFSKESFKDLFGFGSKLLAGHLLWTIYSNLTPLIIGKFFTVKDLGYYSRGTGLAQLPANTLMDILGRVTYPILAKIQDDTDHLIIIYRKYIRSTSMVIMFALLLLAALAKPIVLLVLTEKWVDCIIYLQIFIFSAIFDHIQRLNINLLKVTGRSDYILKLEIYKRLVSTVILVASIPFGVIGICLSKVIYEQIALVFNTYYTGKIFKLGYITQVKDFLPYVFLSLMACLPSYILSFFKLPNICIIIVGAILSILLYAFFLLLKKDSIFGEFAVPLIKKYYRIWRIS